MALYIVKPWYKKEAAPAPIYGAEWSGTSDPSWVRTDDAASFTDPNPYYAGMSGTPSSPFDNILPWSGMRRVTDSTAGELVEIPKFYYKWTRDGAKMKLQISMEQHTDFLVSPAHADRGDGVGERDYVYIGRYHCSANDYKSTSGVLPKVNITRATARTSIHSLGSNVWQYDYALYWTINLLYLVEFANWNSQTCIGYGSGNNSSMENSGASDTMPYHTGTMQTSRTDYGVGIQYRFIENLWANARSFIDGIYFNNTDIYCIKDPANFSDITGGIKVGTRNSGQQNWIKAWNSPNTAGFEYALYPSDYGGSSSTYICDWCNNHASGVVIVAGGNYQYNQNYGLFFMAPDSGVSLTGTEISTRLMVLPPSRLS